MNWRLCRFWWALIEWISNHDLSLLGIVYYDIYVPVKSEITIRIAYIWQAALWSESDELNFPICQRLITFKFSQRFTLLLQICWNPNSCSMFGGTFAFTKTFCTVLYEHLVQHLTFTCKHGKADIPLFRNQILSFARINCTYWFFLSKNYTVQVLRFFSTCSII